MELNNALVTELKSKTYKVEFHCGTLDVTIIRNKNGKLSRINITTSLDIPCFSQLDVISKLIVASVHAGASELDLAANLSDMFCFNEDNISSSEINCLQALAQVLEQDYKNSSKI